MKILFYIPLYKGETYQNRISQFKNGLYPPHLLYGIKSLDNLGYNIVYPSRNYVLPKKNKITKIHVGFNCQCNSYN